MPYSEINGLSLSLSLSLSNNNLTIQKKGVTWESLLASPARSLACPTGWADPFPTVHRTRPVWWRDFLAKSAVPLVESGPMLLT